LFGRPRCADIIRTHLGNSTRVIGVMLSIALLAAVVAACGGGRPVARTSEAPRPTMLVAPRPEPRGWRDPDTSTRIVEATQLVTEDAMWNRVVIHADGHGNVAQWTGETSPIHYFVFRLAGSQLARVRGLISGLQSRAAHSPAFSTAQNALIYTIRTPGRLVRVPDAPGHTGLGPLVAIFDRLISRYS